MKTSTLTKLIIANVFLSTALITSSISFAGEGDHSNKMIDKKMQRLSKKLELSAEQQEKLRPIIQQNHQEKKAAMSSLKESHQARLSTVLNAEQMEKLEAMHKKGMRKFKDKKHHKKY